MLGRTLLQPAAPIVFGIEIAAWIAPLVRARMRLRTAGVAALKLQLGGAVGTRAMLGERSAAIAAAMAAALQLQDAPPWHTQRDELIALGCEVGVLVGSLAKIARDWSLLAQAGIGELAEPSGAGRGGSSAMPHKRNPVAAMTALAAAQRVPQRVAVLLGAMAQEHERGLGNWQAELAEWPGLFGAAHSALKALADAAPELVVDERRMRANLEAMRGLVYAEAIAAHLAAHVGQARAQALLEVMSRRAADERRHLRDVLHEAAAGNETLRRGLDATLFDIDTAVEPARRSARMQLEALHEEAAVLQLQAPWSAFLPAAAPR
jgi:3-carboxy-cis,cis-muconate cycloisomerase